MEVGRVGDLRIRDGSIVRLPLVGSRRMNGTTKKNGLTRAGLLMEVARHPTGALLLHLRKANGLGVPAGYPR